MIQVRTVTTLTLAGTALLALTATENATAAQLYNDYKYPWQAGNTDWAVTQTWHGAAGSFYYKGGNYSWGAGSAIDFQAVSDIPGSGLDVLAPSDVEVASICKDANNQAALTLITVINGQLTGESLGLIHLEANSISLKVGDRVEQGDFLGKVHRNGTTKAQFDALTGSKCGYGAANHLHLRTPLQSSFTIDGDTYYENDNSFLYKEAKSTNSGTNPGPDLDDGPVFSEKDQLTGSSCTGYYCDPIGFNLDALYFESPETFDMLAGTYALEAQPFGRNGAEYTTSTFRYRASPGSLTVLGNLPWGVQGKLLSKTPVIASLSGTSYNWWNVDFFGYGAGWVAGDFMYQRFHNIKYIVFGNNDHDHADGIDYEHPTEDIPEPNSVIGLLLLPFFGWIFSRK